MKMHLIGETETLMTVKARMNCVLGTLPWNKSLQCHRPASLVTDAALVVHCSCSAKILNPLSWIVTCVELKEKGRLAQDS